MWGHLKFNTECSTIFRVNRTECRERERYSWEFCEYIWKYLNLYYTCIIYFVFAYYWIYVMIIYLDDIIRWNCECYLILYYLSVKLYWYWIVPWVELRFILCLNRLALLSIIINWRTFLSRYYRVDFGYIEHVYDRILSILLLNDSCYRYFIILRLFSFLCIDFFLYSVRYCLRECTGTCGLHDGYLFVLFKYSLITGLQYSFPLLISLYFSGSEIT